MKTFDLVIFGASGFTGNFVVENLVQRISSPDFLSKQSLNKKKTKKKFQWAIAGRNSQKLQDVLSKVSKKFSQPNLNEIPILVADVADFDSLKKLCQQTRLVINCVGPYRFYGENVVRACLAEQANYVDLCGEPQFMEQMFAKYHQEAVEKNILILNACGFDSIPADVGVLYQLSEWKDADVLTGVEAFLTYQTGNCSGPFVHFATWEAAVYGFSSVGELAKLRKSAPKSAQVSYLGQELPKRGKVFFSKEMGKWCIPFVGSDSSVVKRTQRMNSQRFSTVPVRFSAYVALPSFFHLVLFLLYGFLFQILCRFPLGRNLLLKYPSYFSHGCFDHRGPDQSVLDKASFSFTFFGKGYEKTKLKDAKNSSHLSDYDKTIVTRVAGPEPGYIATSIMVIEAALFLLQEEDQLLYRGGVLTPGSAFYETTFWRKLQSKGIDFSTIAC